MGFARSLRVSASALTAERLHMDVIANNIANADSTRTPEGGPYRRQRVAFRTVFEQAAGNRSVPAGVAVESVTQDPTDFVTVYDPGHPDADANGIVKKPNVNVVEEMVDMISATRAYEANVTALNAAKSMIASGIEIGRA